MKSNLLICASILVVGTAIAADTKENTSSKPAPASSEKASAPTAEVKDVTPEEAEKILKSKKDVVVLDVRTQEEFEDGHIKGAKNLDVMDDAFAEKLGELDKNKTYVLHCAAGGRSSRVLKEMRKRDFKSVYHMNGGINAWKEAGKPLEK